MIVTFLLAGVVAQTAPRISYSTPAAPVSQVLSDLTERTGTPLRADPAVAKELVVVRFKDVPFDEGLARIAEATSSELIREPEGIRLGRSAEFVQRKRGELAGQRAEWIEREISLLARAKDKQGTFTDETALNTARRILKEVDQNLAQGESEGAKAGIDGVEGTPEWRGLVETLKLLGPSVVAELPEGVTTYFALRPTPHERGLPSGAAAIVKEFHREAGVWVRALNQAVPTSVEAEARSPFVRPDLSRGVDRLVFGVKPERAVSSAFESSRDRLRVSAYFLASDGALIASDEVVLRNRFTAPPSKEEPDAKAFRLSEDSAGFCMLLDSGEGSGSTLQLEQALFNLLLNPGIEPLSLFPSEILLALAEAEGKSLVACLSDEFFVASATIANGARTTAEVLKKLREGQILTLTQDSSWLLLKPNRPLENSSELVDRTLLRGFLKAMVGGDAGGFEELSEYAFRVGVPDEREIAMGVLQMTSLTSLPEYEDWRFVRFYGSLSPSQRDQLRTRRRLSVDGLSQTQRALLQQWVFESEDGLSLSVSSIDPTASDRLTEQFEMGIGFLPHESLPQGYPTGQLALGVESAPVLFGWQPSGAGTYWQPMTTNAVAVEMLRRKRPELFSDAKPNLPMAFSIGVHERQYFELELPRGFSVSTSVDAFRQTDRNRVALSGLPDAIQEEIRRLTAEHERRMDASRRGGPPPR